MRTRLTYGLWAVVAVGLFSGCPCVDRIVELECDGKDADLIATTYNAVDCLVDVMPGKTAPDPNRRMLVATVVNLDQVERTSTFGRLTSELAVARLAQRGYSVVHLNIRRGSVVINQEGQFLLTRDMRKLMEDYNAGSILVSTYTLAPQRVFMSLRIVNAEACTVVSGVDYALPLGTQTRVLLGMKPNATASPYAYHMPR